MYLQGPWQKGTPAQGYQLPMTPAEFFRAGITATNAHCRKTYQKEFDRLSREQQIALLKDSNEASRSTRYRASSSSTLLLEPEPCRGSLRIRVYGGNRDKVAWKMIGFPAPSPSTRSTSRPIATRNTTSSRRASSISREASMPTRLKEVDVVIVGLGWTGGILAKELTEAGMQVVALERGRCAAPTRIFSIR